MILTLAIPALQKLQLQRLSITRDIQRKNILKKP